MKRKPTTVYNGVDLCGRSEQIGEELTVDYVNGDNLIASFDADNPEDMERVFSSDGEVLTTTFTGETYAYTSKVSYGSVFKVPQILPALSEKEPVYVKLRIHAAFDNTADKTVYVGAYDENDVLLQGVFTDFNTEGKTTLDMPVPNNGTVKYFKVFIWDENIVPVAKPTRLDN